MLENEDFLKAVTALTQEAKCQLTVCTREQSVGDRWMQVCSPVGQGSWDTRGGCS